ncbi:hypothetical protein HPP92_001515 [Vanilla planifolia]|uniref:RecA-like N-terminal domain-containing protein n=1 Tax=Vanilla planifolia TaxID=51239 RepID=A0A835VLM0_VANPL|nr:hypothetical protein HPP92_001515 [Vanilla planifolia]
MILRFSISLVSYIAGCCAYLDVENAMEPSLAEAMGVNTENLLFARPSCAEKTLSIVNTLVNSASVDVIVVDSVAALVSECELNSMIDIESHDVQPRLMTQALRKIQHSLYRSQALVIFVNQVRKSTKPSKGFSIFTQGNKFMNYTYFWQIIRSMFLVISNYFP